MLGGRGDRPDPPWVGRGPGGAPVVTDPAAYYEALRGGAEPPQCARCGDAGFLRQPGGDPRPCACLATAVPLSERLRGMGIEPERTFEDWRTTAAMEPARRAAIELLDGARWCCFIRAGVGSGKTHLALATAREHLLRGGRPRFWNVADLLRELRHTHKPDGTADLEEFLRARVFNADLLVLDDLGAERPTVFAAEQIFAIVDRCYRGRDEGRRLMVTSNVRSDAADADALIDPRTRDRLAPGEVEIARAPSRRREFDA